MSPETVKEARRKLGLSQSEFAERLGLQSDRNVRRWETGERQPSGPAARLIELIIDGRWP